MPLRMATFHPFLWLSRSGEPTKMPSFFELSTPNIDLFISLALRFVLILLDFLYLNPKSDKSRRASRSSFFSACLLANPSHCWGCHNNQLSATCHQSQISSTGGIWFCQRRRQEGNWDKLHLYCLNLDGVPKTIKTRWIEVETVNIKCPPTLIAQRQKDAMFFNVGSTDYHIRATVPPRSLMLWF